jgi:hypothetical protein
MTDIKEPTTAGSRDRAPLRSVVPAVVPTRSNGCGKLTFGFQRSLPGRVATQRLTSFRWTIQRPGFRRCLVTPR